MFCIYKSCFVRKIFRFKFTFLTLAFIFLSTNFFITKSKPGHNIDNKNLLFKESILNSIREKEKNILNNYLIKDGESYYNKTSQIRSSLNSLHSNEKIIELTQRPASSLNKNKYLIVEYTNVFYASKFCDLKENNIYSDKCLYKNCVFTCDKSNVYTADALLFHDFDLNQLSIEDRIFSKYTLSKSKSRQNQVWILWNDEPNLITSANQIDYYLFNWTMSYRIDSEVSDCAYGCYSLKTHNISEANREKMLLEQFKKEYAQRENSALWFVSNCRAEYRLRFAQKLQDYFNIRVYGECKYKMRQFDNSYITELYQTLKQTIKSIFTSISIFKKMKSDSCDRNSNCEEYELKKNKFYLSFESQNCTNYITEKFWRILNANSIPIVLQPTKAFYELIAPPSSYIHAQDFDYDASKLAEYLRVVSNNFEEYFKYQKWRLTHDISFANKQTEARRICELCTKLNTETSRIYYPKLSKWFNSGCVRN